ncbi:MAG: hypothetical protein KF832_31105 [Caldilineaceae bacterium]|nr:hypothetical protein [Caldilineaceae bacterium]
MRNETYSRLAAKLGPHLNRLGSSVIVDGGSAGIGAAPGIADYVATVDEAACRVYDKAGKLAFTGANHATVIQQAINAAGVNGAIAFRPGTYWVDTQLTPLARQSWYCPFGAIFRPVGNNRILFLQDLDWFALYGTLHIEDTDRHTSSVEAIYLDGVNGCYFQDIMVWDYYRGVAIWGTTRRTYENIFDNIRLNVVRHEGLIIKQEVGDNYFNNVFIKGPSTVEWATGAGFVIGLYPGTGTIFGGLMFGRLEVLDCWVNLDLQGLYECWFDQILSDNAYFAAMYIGDNVQRLFIGGIWTAGSGDGLWIQGSAASSAKRIRINAIFSWINAQTGIHFNGYVEDVHIGSVYLLENQVAQLKFSRGHIRNVSIDNLTTAVSNAVAIDCGGIDSIQDNIAINHAELDPGECMGLDLLRHIDGVRDGKLFANRGVAYIPAGETTVTVPHGLEGRPLYVQLTPHFPDARQAYIQALDMTNLVIAAHAPVGTTSRVAWVARSGVEVGNELLLNSNVDSGAPENWSAGGGALVETEDVYNGTQALRINSNFARWWSWAFTAYPFARYRIQGYIKGAGNPFAQLAIHFWSDAGGSGALLQAAALALPSIYDYSQGYVRVQGDFSAPAGTVSADLIFRNTAGNTTDVYGDDFAFHLSAGGSNLLTDPSVETLTGWALDGATWETGTARTGSHSLRLTNSTDQKQARAQWVVIAPSTSYTASAWLQGQASGNVALVVQWFSDAGGIGNLIREDTQYFTGTYASWTQVSAAFVAPATAQSAYVVFRMAGWIAYDLKGDAFSVRQLI